MRRLRRWYIPWSRRPAPARIHGFMTDAAGCEPHRPSSRHWRRRQPPLGGRTRLVKLRFLRLIYCVTWGPWPLLVTVKCVCIISSAVVKQSQTVQFNSKHTLLYSSDVLLCKNYLTTDKRKNHIIIIIIISSLQHYECIAPLVANNLQSGQFWARSTASVHDSPWESRSYCTVFIQVFRGHPGDFFQYTEGEEVKICLAFILSSIRAIYNHNQE